LTSNRFDILISVDVLDRVDVFTLPFQWVGVMDHIRLRHDNTGISPGWYVDKVVVEDLETHDVYVFPCRHWLAKDEDGSGHLARYMSLNGVEGMLYDILDYRAMLLNGVNGM